MMKLNFLFQNGMVLQRGKKVHIWGMTDPYQKVRVEIQNFCVEAYAGADGKFCCTLPPLDVSQKETLLVQGGNEKIEFTDIAVGEVWICGGQSNMEFPLKYEKHRSEQVVVNSERIRFFDTPRIFASEMEGKFDYSSCGVWRNASQANIDYFSAVGFYFAKKLERELDCPVGLIGCNFGGTMIEGWMSYEGAKELSPVWFRKFEEEFAEKDMGAYWKNIADDPMNDHGSIINPINDVILPVTVSNAEFCALLGIDEDAPIEEFMSFRPEWIPGILFEYMVKKIASFAVAGVLWYQGESNDDEGQREPYAALLTRMIEDWRLLWDDDLPFIVVQLPGFEEYVGLPNFDYTTIRQAQQEAVDHTSNAYLCSISDIGERWDIHPKNKLPVGERLSRLALRYVYQQDILADAPRAVAGARADSQIIITVENAGDGLKILEGDLPLRLYEGEKEICFSAEVYGNQLFINSDEISDTKLRIEFAREKWFAVNIFNSADIPMLPFVLEI